MPDQYGTNKTETHPQPLTRQDQILADNRLIASEEFINTLLDSLPMICMILNEYRQVLYMNKAFNHLIGEKDSSWVLGLRPGQAFHCINSTNEPLGCGTKEQCRVCGALQTVLQCQREKKFVTNEARLRVQLPLGEESFNIRVTAKPFPYTQREFLLVTIENITHEKNRQMLERTFFHDLINTAGSIMTIAEIMREQSSGPEDLVQTIVAASNQLYEEIQFHKMVSTAEGHLLEPQKMVVSLHETITETVAFIQKFSTLKYPGIAIRVEVAPPITIFSDPTILKRVFINMLKNALEASKSGDVVTTGYAPASDTIRLWVHNAASIPTDVQFQIFQRFFSTKGPGRGIGTYSIKMLTERYLDGSASFESSPETGTTFTITLPLRAGTEII